MCFGGNNDAARWEANIAKVEQKNEEAERQARVVSGQQQIDQAFSQFDPAYYKRFQDASVAAQSPQVEDQYAKARDKATALLAGRGVLKSTIASNAFGDVEKTKATVLGQVANDAVTQANALRAAVEKQKTDLYALNTSAADPTAIANRAAGEATALVAPAPTTPLGDIFGSSIKSLGTAAQADAYSPYGGRVASWFTPPTGGTREKVYG
jgi:hypothetical protein